MPIALTEIRQVQPFCAAHAVSIVAPATTTPATPLAGIHGWIWGSGIRNTNPRFSVNQITTYRQIDDTLITFSPLLIRGASVLILYNDSIARFDSQCLGPNVGSYRDNWGSNTNIATNFRKLFPAQMQIESGVQKLYLHRNFVGGGGIGWYEVNPVTLDYVDASAAIFTVYSAHLSTVAIANNGYYTGSGIIGNTTTQKNLLFMSGITDSTGMADRTDGPTSTHANGLVLQKVDALQLSGVSIGAAFAWVDPDTGNAVGKFNIPHDTLGGTGTQSEPNLGGNSFDWSIIQFSPDSDSLDAKPKGELHAFSSLANNTITTSGVFNDIAMTAFTGHRVFVTSYDFNPFNLTTGTQRIHARRTFVGSIAVPAAPAFPSGPTLDGTSNGPFNDGIYFHQPSNSYFMHNGFTDNDIRTDPIITMPATNDWRLIRWLRAAPVESLDVSPLGEVTTNATVRHECVAYGEFAFRASGVNLTATLKRASTEEEQFTPALATSAIIVAAAVIDDDGFLEVYEGSVATGTLLAITTNYTVNFSTGTITGVNFTPAVAHSVNYRHRSNELSPSHGSLITSSASTDTNGVAFFDVQYADASNLAGHVDSLTIVSI